MSAHDLAVQQLLLRRLYDRYVASEWSPLPAQFPISPEEQLVACQQLAAAGLIEWNWSAGEVRGRITPRGLDVVEGKTRLPGK
jgi:hypothetical protein